MDQIQRLIRTRQLPGRQRRVAQRMARGLPAVFGEVVDEVGEASRFLLSFENIFETPKEALGEYADRTVCHYCLLPEQVRACNEEVGLAIEEEGRGEGHAHVVVTKRADTQPVWGD